MSSLAVKTLAEVIIRMYESRYHELQDGFIFVTIVAAVNNKKGALQVHILEFI